MTTKKRVRTHAAEVARAMKLVAGIAKYFANLQSIKFASADHTPAELTTALLELVALHTALEAARAALKAKLAAFDTNAPALRKEMAGLVAFVMVAFSESPDILAEFGLEPRKPRTPLTTQKQTVANAKREATREVNGTNDRIRKKGRKGNVVGVVVTPVTVAPEAPTGGGPATALPRPAGRAPTG